MLKSCSYCGGIHQSNFICPKKPKRKYKGELSEDRKIYATQRWNNLKADIEQGQDYLCLFSLYVVGNLKYCSNTHHIITIHDNINLAFEDDNLIGLDSNVHKCIHALYKINKKVVQDILRECKKLWNDGVRLEGLGMLKHRLSNEMMEVIYIYLDV